MSFLALIKTSRVNYIKNARNPSSPLQMFSRISHTHRQDKGVMYLEGEAVHALLLNVCRGITTSIPLISGFAIKNRHI